MLNAFASRYGDTPKAPRSDGSGGALVPRETALQAVSRAFVVESFRARLESLTARRILDACPELPYERPNAIGDLLGHGRKGHNLGLRREQGGYPCTRENLRRALQVMTETTLTAVLETLGLDLDGLAAELEKFPAEPEDTDSIGTYTDEDQ